MFNYMTVWPITEMTGYEPKTTYWNDFETAEMFSGMNGVRKTYKNAFKNWKDNVEYITEICMVLNWRAWLWSDRSKSDEWGGKGLAKQCLDYAKLYTELWEECDTWCCNNLKGEDLNYFYRTTDQEENGKEISSICI